MAVAVYDVRITHNPKFTVRDIVVVLRQLFKKWVFQIERGELTGVVHLQIRGSLWKKKTPAMAQMLCDDTCLAGSHWMRTSSEVAKGGSFDYVMKIDTRVDGPWRDTDPDPEVVDITVVTSPLRPWQKDLHDYIEGPIDSRKIKVIVDPHGGRGKGHMRKWLRWQKKAIVIPPMRKAEDIIAMVMCQPPHRCYVCDVPRSQKPKLMEEFWAGMESIKDGYVWDKRFKFRDRQFPTPHVIIFTNKTPEYEHLSLDRWDFVYLQPDF